MKVVAIVASRYGSTRFPAKALADIHGKPMVWWAYQNTKNAKNIDEVYVATDDMRIVEVCNKYSIPTIMTKTTHREAANRIQEVSESIKADFYIQVNGDEPLINPKLISMAIPEIIDQEVEFGTNIITKMYNPVEVIDTSNIKVIFNHNMKTLYMSRTPIPCPYKSLDFVYYKHVGIIGYNKKMLDFYANNPPGKMEQIEGIATLRFTDYDRTLLCVEADNVETLSVDTPKDLEKVQLIVKSKLNKGEFSSDFVKLLEQE